MTTYYDVAVLYRVKKTCTILRKYIMHSCMNVLIDLNHQSVCMV